MPFTTDYTPISAALKLGSIAGAGSGMIQQQAKRLQDQQVAAQLAQQNIANQLAAEQQQRQATAADQSNKIQTAMAYDRMNQQQQQFETEQQAQQAHTAAQQMFSQNQQTENVREFNAKNAVDQSQQHLQQQKFDTEQTQKTGQEDAVNGMIDQLGLPAQEAQRLKLQFKATGRLPAPAGENEARNLNALTIARKTLLDPYGDVLPGKQGDLAAMDQQIASLVQGLGGGVPQTPGSIPAAPVAPAGPQNMGHATSIQPTGKHTPEGVPLAIVTVNGSRGPQKTEVPAPASPQQATALPKGVTYVTPDGQLYQR